MIKKVREVLCYIAELIYKHYHLIIGIMLVTYFAQSLTEGLIKGGRWDLYQNIAMADRFLAGEGFYYSAIESSSPYFPGVAFLSVLIGKFFNPWRDYIMLVIASLIGTAFFYMLIKLGELLSKNRVIAVTFTFLLMSLKFNEYRFYMNEFKADSLVLLLAVFIVLLIDNIEQKKSKVNASLIFTLFALGFIMDITKQQALYVDVAIGLYLLFTKRLVIKEKVLILGSLIWAGIVAILIIFHIPGSEIQTINNLSAMPYRSMEDILDQMNRILQSNTIYFVFLVLFLYLIFDKKIRLNSLAVKWLIIAIAFGIGQVLGAWKTGGNGGNYEVAMVPFIPFLVMAVVYVYENYIAHNKQKVVISLINYVVCFVCLVILVQVYEQSHEVANKIHTDNEVANYLSEKFGEETIMYSSNYYMQLARSTVKPGMDLHTLPANMEEYWFTREEYLKNQTYKYLYVDAGKLEREDAFTATYFGQEVDAAGALEKYYEEIVDSDMPECLKGQLFIAK